MMQNNSQRDKDCLFGKTSGTLKSKRAQDESLSDFPPCFWAGKVEKQSSRKKCVIMTSLFISQCKKCPGDSESHQPGAIRHWV